MARLRRSKITQSEFFPGFADITEIGVGSLATVYRAREIGTNRQVALKLLNVRDASPRALESFERESMALGALSSHPNIVTLYRSFRAADGRPVLVLELCAGAIGDRLQGGQGLAVPDVVSLGIKIAGALETAHRGGILHRDVKPQNILVTEFGEPALADFGVAMLQSSTQTTAGLFDFTTLHAAPELLEGGDTSAATDVYELASSLYQLVAGRSAFRAFDEESPAAVILRILRDPVQPLAHTQAPTALSDLFIRAMAKDKGNRPATAAEFASDLAAIEIAENWPRTQFLVREPVTPAPGPWTAAPQPPVITREPWTAAPPPEPAGRSFASLPADLPPQPPRVVPPPVDDPWSSATLSRHAAADPAAPVAEPVPPTAPPRPSVVSTPPVAPTPVVEPWPQAIPPPPPPPPPAPVAPAVVPPPPVAAPPASPVPDDDYRAWRPPPLLPRADAQPEPRSEPVAEQTTRRSMLPPSAWSPQAPEQRPTPPEPPAPEPVVPQPSDRTPLRIDEGLNPPSDATVVRSSLPRVAPAVPPPTQEQAAGSGPSPWVPQAEATVSRASLSDIPEAPSGGPEQTVFRSSLPQIPQAPPSDGGNETVARSSLAGAPQAYPIAPQGAQQQPGQAVPTWATRAQPPAAGAAGTGQSPLDLTLDPASLRKRVTIRAGAAALAIDETRLVLRSYLRKTEIPWTEILGFEPRFDGVGAGGSGGHLVAITRSGPVELPATKRSVADLRYMQALLEAYLRRAHSTIPPR